MAIWDAKGNRAIIKSKEAMEVNFALDDIKAQIVKLYQRLSDREAFVTAEMVRNAYQGYRFVVDDICMSYDKMFYKDRVERDLHFFLLLFLYRANASNFLSFNI